MWSGVVRTGPSREGDAGLESAPCDGAVWDQLGASTWMGGVAAWPPRAASLCPACSLQGSCLCGALPCAGCWSRALQSTWAQHSRRVRGHAAELTPWTPARAARR